MTTTLTKREIMAMLEPFSDDAKFEILGYTAESENNRLEVAGEVVHAEEVVNEVTGRHVILWMLITKISGRFENLSQLRSRSAPVGAGPEGNAAGP
jgi:hypothetical protein